MALNQQQRLALIFKNTTGANAAPTATPTPQAIVTDPRVSQGLGAATHTREGTINGINANEVTTRRDLGIKKAADGTEALDFGDPRSRAYALQAQWAKTKAGNYQHAGNNLYSGSYLDQVAEANAGEMSDYGSLLSQGTDLLGGYARGRTGAITTEGDAQGAIRADEFVANASAPNSNTVADQSTGVNPDGSAKTVGQSGVNIKTGQPYIIWHNSKGQAYNVYADGHKVRMKANDKKVK